MNDDRYPEGFDVSCGIPARYMQAANSSLAGLQNDRKVDVPTLAIEMMALVGKVQIEDAQLQAGLKHFLDSVATSRKDFGGRRCEFLASSSYPRIDMPDVRLLRFLDDKLNPHLLEFDYGAVMQVPEFKLSFTNSPGWRSLTETQHEMERQEKFVLERLGSEPSWFRRTFKKVDSRLMLWHSGWRADVDSKFGFWTFSARVAAVRILA